MSSSSVCWSPLSCSGGGKSSLERSSRNRLDRVSTNGVGGEGSHSGFRLCWMLLSGSRVSALNGFVVLKSSTCCHVGPRPPLCARLNGRDGTRGSTWWRDARKCYVNLSWSLSRFKILFPMYLNNLTFGFYQWAITSAFEYSHETVFGASPQLWVGIVL